MRRTAVAALLLLILAASCGGDEPAPPSGAAAEDGHGGSEGELVGYAALLAQIRGHHRVALELYRTGDHAGAAAHAAHPVEEILPTLRGELEEHAPEAAPALAEALQRVEAAAGHTAAVGGDLAAEVADAAAATEAALDALAGETSGEAGFTGSVIAIVLDTAAHEYGEAVAAKPLDLAEYQDAYGFLLEAEALYEGVAGEIATDEPEEAAEIDEAFEILADALPGPRPPRRPVPLEDVEDAAALIAHELEETVGAQPVSESDPQEVADEIEDLLDEIATRYAAGEAEVAAELAAEAYLENYEVIEAQVIEHAPEINEELEPLLGADLRRRINEGADVSDIEAMIERAKELLDQAIEALEEAE